MTSFSYVQTMERMEERSHLEGLIFSSGWLASRMNPSDGRFSRCPFCSPGTARLNAIRTFLRQLECAARRDELSSIETGELVAFAASGTWELMPFQMKNRKVITVKESGRRQRVKLFTVTQGLHRLLWRIVGASPFHGQMGASFGKAKMRFFNVGDNRPTRPTSRILQRRTVEGTRQAITAMHWLWWGTKIHPSAVVRALFDPCGQHEAKVDHHYCAWNSERGRLKGGIVVQKNRGPRSPERAERPVERTQKSVLDELADRHKNGEKFF